MLDVTLLGCGGMMPLKNRWLTSCLLHCEGRSVLVDCGEGTQIAMKMIGARFKPIDLICFTHYHADHISGLPGLLLSMGNEGREEPVTFAGPKGLEQIVRSLCVIAPNLPFEMQFMELNEIHSFSSGALTVTPFHAQHSIECFGYRFDLPRKGKFNPEKAKQNEVPMVLWGPLRKNGEMDYEGKHYTYDMVSDGERKGIRLVYCTDSRPTETIVKNAVNADLFICEGLYDDPAKLTKVRKAGHMLYREAAEMARKADVRQLWLTHFSPALKEPEAGIDAARSVFSATECGYDGKSICLRFDDQTDSSMNRE